MKRTLFLLCSLLVVLCGVAMLLLSGMNDPPEDSPREDPPVAAGPRSEVDSPVPLTSSRAERTREPAAGLAPEERGIEPAEETGALAPEGIALRGTVRWSDDGAPVPHLRLVAHGVGATRFAMVSDGSGEFESEPVLRAGRLRLRQMGEAPVATGAQRYPRGLRFASEVFVVPEGAEEFEIELVLERPARRLLVEVRDRFAQPVDGARVSLETLVQTGGEAQYGILSQTTDRGGGVEFALYGLEGIRALGLFAVLSGAEGSGPAQVSDHRSLDLPLPVTGDVTERLVLDDAARLLVRTVDESGMPIAGHWVWLEVGEDPLFAWLPEGGVTNADGEKRFDALPPRTYGVATGTGPGRVDVRVELMRGVEQELELVVPGSAPRLAASGVVLDETGAPLRDAMVTVRYGPRFGPGDTSSTRMTDEEGRFEFRAAPCDGLTVLLDGGLQGDEFTPASISASFGDGDLVFRRTRSFARRELDMEIADAVTGESVERALVMIVRPPATESYDFKVAVGGLVTIVVSEHPDVRLLIDAAGYRRRSVALPELVRPEPNGRLHRVMLEVGLLQTLEVHGEPEEGGDETTLAEAEVWEGTRRLGVTDGEGRLTLDLRHWPTQALRVEAEGHHPALWSPANGFGEPGPALVWLEPAR